MNVHIEKYILISFYCVTVQPQKLRVSPLVFPLSHYQWLSDSFLDFNNIFASFNWRYSRADCLLR